MASAPQFADRCQGIFNRAPHGIVTVDASGCFVDANPAACLIFGHPHERVVGHHFTEFMVSPETVMKIRDAVNARGSLTGELSVRRPDGSIREVQFSSVAEILPGLNMSILRDVTDERTGQDLALQLAAIVGSSTDALYWAHPEGTIQSWNHGAEVIYGFASKEIIGQPASRLAGPDRQDEVLGILARVRQGDFVKQLETSRQRSDGMMIQVSVTASPIHGAGDVVVGVALIDREITEYKSLETQLRHAQKMEAIGQLAGGIAHDFNNLLTIINGNCELLREGMRLPETCGHVVTEIADAGARAASLTRQLLLFGRKEVASPSIVNLNPLIVGLEKMLRRLVGEDVALHCKLLPDLDSIEADSGQLEQVITNLVTNARDAMPNGG